MSDQDLDFAGKGPKPGVQRTATENRNDSEPAAADQKAAHEHHPAAESTGMKAVNWITSVVRPKIRSIWKTRDTPDNLWVKCPETGQMVYFKDLEANQYVMPVSNYHMRMPPTDRLASVMDEGQFQRIAIAEVPLDPLKFRDEKRYTDRLRKAREDTDQADAVIVAEGPILGVPVVVAVQDFRFMGGSLGMAAGEAVITGMLRAVEKHLPFILFAASGGARMQEGVLSLMQMPRTTVAVQRLKEARLPYIVVLTDPTTGGVTASYAMLGDVHIAEPGALIGFAGPRVIEQTIREQLPEGFQRAEYLMAHGMVDMVIHRHKLRETLSRLSRVLMGGNDLPHHLRNGNDNSANKTHGANGLNGAGSAAEVAASASSRSVNGGGQKAISDKVGSDKVGSDKAGGKPNGAGRRAD